MTEKPRDTKTIEISTVTHEKLCVLQEKTEAIVSAGRKNKRHVSLDQIIQLAIAFSDLEDKLTDLQLWKG
jgi:hypothetical protein